MLRIRPAAGLRELERPERRDYFRFRVRPVGASLGALVEGIELANPCDDATFSALVQALQDWKVLFFRDQSLDAERQALLCDRFGLLSDDTLVPRTADRHAEDISDMVVVFTRDATTVGLENEWHGDGTFRPMPTMGTMLRAIEVPEVGGDTLFADMSGAFMLLPAELRRRVVGLTAIHDWSIGAYAAKYGDRLDALRAAHPPVAHPVVIRHPATGRPTLFVNRLFTREIVGLRADEGEELLAALCGMVDLPEVQVRWRWEPGSVALWDNVACNHYGANDYYPARRVMARTTFFSREHERLLPWTDSGCQASSPSRVNS
ncbi:MAG: TauD/TfdA family dioxygenase [Deltaproteobacteria bacterium]|nr:TauD/TfdA family dioxygenase [Deltaproteobacteria bacterium]